MLFERVDTIDNLFAKLVAGGKKVEGWISGEKMGIKYNAWGNLESCQRRAGEGGRGWTDCQWPPHTAPSWRSARLGRLAGRSPLDHLGWEHERGKVVCRAGHDRRDMAYRGKRELCGFPRADCLTLTPQT